jgi:sirohydrochlorin ferrochelatase
MRPDLRIEPAFLELSKPSFSTVVNKLVRAGYDEIVVVPLLLTEAYHAAGSSDPLANQAVARLARMWGSKHKLPTVAAFASAAPPATGEAVRQFRAEGRRHIAVGSLFLAPGTLPDRAAELALEAGAVAVSAPLGADAEVARTILARYAVGAVELVPV